MGNGDRVDELDRLNEDRGHRITIGDRDLVSISGVLGVDNFDDREIVLQTELGTLVLRGEDLQVEEFDLDDGKFICRGLFVGLQYSAGTGSKSGKGGWLSRLLH